MLLFAYLFPCSLSLSFFAIDDSGDECPMSSPSAGQSGASRNSEVQSTLRTLGSKVEDLSTCNDLIAKHGSALQRSGLVSILACLVILVCVL